MLQRWTACKLGNHAYNALDLPGCMVYSHGGLTRTDMIDLEEMYLFELDVSLY